MIFGLRVLVIGGCMGVFFKGQLYGFFYFFPTKNLKVFNFDFHFNIIFGRAIGV
jgi:hypothetical protein